MALPFSQELLGTIPGWITAGGVMTLLGLVLRYRVALRGQDMTADEQIRTHFAKEVEALRQQFRDLETHYRKMLEEADQRHEECQRDRDRLRERVKELEDHVAGLERKISTLSTDRVLALSEKDAARAPSSVGAAMRIRENGYK